MKQLKSITVVLALLALISFPVLLSNNKAYASSVSVDPLIPPGAITDYQYQIAGGGTTPISPTGTPVNEANLGSVGAITVDSNNNIFFYSSTSQYGSQVDMEPAVSGTYFGVAMTEGNIYRILGTGQPDTFNPTGIGGPALLASGISSFGINVDRYDNVYLGQYMIPNVAGTYFGVSMQAGYVYEVVAGGTVGDSQNDIPATSAKFGISGTSGYMTSFTADQYGNLYIVDSYNDVVDMVPTNSGTYFGIAMTAGYIYTIVGVNTPVMSSNCPNGSTDFPAFGTSIKTFLFTYCNPQSILVDLNGNLIISDYFYTDFVPAVSGTYYGQSMTADDVYEIQAVGSDKSYGIPSGGVPALNSGGNRPAYVGNNDNLYFTNDSNSGIAMMPETSGTYFGIPMKANYVYPIAGPLGASGSIFLHPTGIDAMLFSPNLGSSGPGTIAVDSAGNILCSEFAWAPNSINYIDAIVNSGVSSSVPPLAPVGIGTYNSTSSAIALSWAGGQDSGSYISDYKVGITPKGSSGTTIVDTGSPSSIYSNSALVPGDTYSFSVAATNAYGTSAYSQSPPITLSSSVPGHPNIHYPQPGLDSITLSWSAPNVPSGASAISDYIVSVYGLNGTYQMIDTGSINTTYTVTGLLPNVYYYLGVTAENASGYGPSSGYNFATVANPPSAPTSVSASSAVNGIQVSWTPPTTDGGSPVTSYELTVNPTGGTPTSVNVGNVTTYTDTSLTVGTQYTFNVTAVNVAGNSSPSVSSNQVTDGVPSAPTVINAEGGSALIDVIWNTPSNIGASAITDYIVTEYPTGSSPVTIDTKSTSNLLVLNSMSTTTAYGFSVTAVNSYGDSTPSVESNLTVPAAEPGPPTEFNTTFTGQLGSYPTFQYYIDYPEIAPLNVTSYYLASCSPDTVSVESSTFSSSSCNPNVLLAVESQNGSYTSTGGISGCVGCTAGPIQPTPPVATTTSVSGGITLSINNPTGNISYVAEVIPSVGSDFTVSFSSSSYTVTGLSSSLTYQFVIFALNQYSWSLPYTTVDPSPLATPVAPTGVSGSPGNATVSLSWVNPNPASPNPVTDYLINVSNGTQIDTHSTNTSYNVSSLTNGTAYTFTVQAINANGTSQDSSTSNSVIPHVPYNEFNPMTPTRIVDTRANSGYYGQNSTLGANSTLSVNMSNFNVPSTATSVVLNVTVTNTTQWSFMSVYPDSTTVPNTSNLNWLAGQTKANMVQVSLPINDTVDFYNAFGNADLVVDLLGYYEPSFSYGGMYNPITPTRICDTRVSSNQCSNKAFSPSNESDTIQITNNANIDSNAEAVVLNITATDTSSWGYMTVSANGSTSTSSVNFNGANDTQSNRIIVPLSSTGTITVVNNNGSADLVIDVEGYFTSNIVTATGFGLTDVNGIRIADTRANSNQPFANSTLQANSSITIPITGLNSIPTDATAAVINVTVTNTMGWGYVSVTPNGTGTTSDVNFTGKGQTVANLDVATLSSTGTITITNGSSTPVDVIVDLFGYYS